MSIYLNVHLLTDFETILSVFVELTVQQKLIYCDVSILSNVWLCALDGETYT